MKSVGIIGGLGPETTAEFYMDIIKKNAKRNNRNPKILIHNVPMPFELQEDIVKKARNEHKLLPLLLEALDTLQDKVDFIVMPCNTAHVFIDDLRRKSKVPVLSIIEVTVKEIKKRNIKQVGILATSKTVEKKLFESKLIENDVKQLKPTEENQRRVSEIINLLLNGEKSNDLKSELLKIVDDLKDAGAEAAILGCTDLQLLLKHGDSPLSLIDSMEVLAESAVEMINQ